MPIVENARKPAPFPPLSRVQAKPVANVDIAAEKIEKRVHTLLAQGRKLSAIKLWKDHYGCDLRIALDQVNALQDAGLVGA